MQQSRPSSSETSPIEAQCQLSAEGFHESMEDGGAGAGAGAGAAVIIEYGFPHDVTLSRLGIENAGMRNGPRYEANIGNIGRLTRFSRRTERDRGRKVIAS
ncbi:uncharacterized protein TRUGW13939_08786 [Talaromyces rugulosus]|uniref:Uncharacterized protein n=1 Tax=Talaromyces rugulosus TaxID=121627 RepID=A0A7H8R5H3_TALRU|nr:uncharacterized protein TRUGW13939_08786 [Talaromyces rugulosus]QKX61634.1 hypothetical protein TRUGW13939_08786 [Talaromyces rugulosus]